MPFDGTRNNVGDCIPRLWRYVHGVNAGAEIEFHDSQVRASAGPSRAKLELTWLRLRGGNELATAQQCEPAWLGRQPN
jgi:hypothetical protein